MAPDDNAPQNDNKAKNPTNLKFRNGVEESVWIALLCALITAPRVKQGTMEHHCLWADALLEAYRNRLQDGKPSPYR